MYQGGDLNERTSTCIVQCFHDYDTGNMPVASWGVCLVLRAGDYISQLYINNYDTNNARMWVRSLEPNKGLWTSWRALQHSLSQINGAYIEQAYINASGKMTVEILSEASNHAGFLIWLDGNNYPVLASIGGQSTEIFMGYLEVKRISNTKFELTNTPWSYGFVMSAYPMIVKSIQLNYLIVVQLFPRAPYVVLLDSH